MRLFVVFLVLCFLAGMAGRPTGSDARQRWFIIAMFVMLVIGYYVFRRI